MKTDTLILLGALILIVPLIVAVVLLAAKAFGWAFAPSLEDRIRDTLRRPAPPEPDPLDYVRDARPQPHPLTFDEQQRLKAMVAGGNPPPATPTASGTATAPGSRTDTPPAASANDLLGRIAARLATDPPTAPK